MLKKSISAIISVILALTLCVGTCASAFAASSGKKYVKEVILSYGNTADEAKKWLTDNDYEVLDSNLNDGADDTFSTKRAVYLGYKTTDKADEAITDMKVMNMNGGYSVQDYQMLLSEQKDNLKVFFDNFKVAVQEYRNNYNAKQQRAISAHDMLNMLYDDDTKQNLGDLLLNRVREEYTDDEYNALSDEQKAKVGDMTTILMQGNADAILAMEQIIATATDESETPWTNRYQEAKTYDEMLENLMESEDRSVNDAEKELISKYDDDAKKIAVNFQNYKDYVAENTIDEISLESTADEIDAYQKAHEDFNYADWCAVATQCEVLKNLKNDDVSLYDLIFSGDYDTVNDDRQMLYPLVSVLSDGQRACLDFLSTYQLIGLGINDDTATKATMKQFNITSNDSANNISIYNGIDRTVFGNDVALTGDAYKLQASSGKEIMENWSAPISVTSIVLWSAVLISTAAMVFSWTYSSHLAPLVEKSSEELTRAQNAVDNANKCITNWTNSIKEARRVGNTAGEEAFTKVLDQYKETKVPEKIAQKEKALSAYNSTSTWAKVMNFAKVAMTCVTAVLLGLAIWNTVVDLQEYYNAEFTPIPSNMVNQSVNDDDEKVYTYYKAVKCNRAAQNMVTDRTKLLGDYGDLNGDVGKQWVALYTTTDSAAGDPITTDFKVQYKDTNVPDDSTALSIFCESVAQNLTNKKAGYTYADSKGGIYLFYGTDKSALAGSVISTEHMSIAIAAGIGVAIGVVVDMVLRKTKNKKKPA